MKCIHGHYYSELDNHHICMHYNTYFEEPMTESPNDSDSVKELRKETNNIKKLFIDLEEMTADLDFPLNVQEELECQLAIARKLLRCWKKATEKDHTTDERYLLNRLTDRLLND